MSNNNNNNNFNNKNNGNKKPWNNWKKPWFNKNKPWFNKKKTNNNNSGNNNDDENPANTNPKTYNNKRPNYNQNNNQKLYSDDLADSEELDPEVSSALIFDSTAKDDDNIIEESTDSKFPMWHLYFPKEKFKEESDSHNLVKIFMALIDNLIELDKYNINKIIENHSFDISYTDLISNPIIENEMPEFKDKFPENPELYLNCINMAMHQCIIDRYTSLIEQLKTKKTASNMSSADTTSDSSSSTSTQFKNVPSFYTTKSMPALNVRLLNFNKSTKIRDLKAVMYNQFVSLTGTVVKISNPKPFVTRLAFECKNCKTTFQLALVEGKYQNPTRCVNKVCNSKVFLPMRKHFMSKVVEWQRLKLQEVILDHSDKDIENGRIPRTIDCELTEDLTGICSPGDLVTINGIVKALTAETAGAGRSNKDKCTYVLYISVNSVQGMISSKSDENSLKHSKNIEFTPKNLKAFEEILSEPDPFKILVNSVCPSIFGHELVKAGLLLGLVGGSRKSHTNDMSIRCDPHILIVGDPGLGKSQLLRACANISPRGVYVCGNSTTTAGLTVTLSKESGDDFALEAGALLCAHNGSCCIDEFDKMGAQQQTLLEAMEQQCISIAKGGIVATLPCRTTVLAAANPIGGHYDKSKTVSENLKLSGPLLSRFDLLFILLDKPDVDLDTKLSGHILAMHNQSKDIIQDKSFNSYQRQTKSVSSTQAFNKEFDLGDSDINLAERLKMPPDSVFDPIPAPLLRKYIMYVKSNIEPVIGKEAAHVLRDFYVKLRMRNKQTNGCNPITMRQLESLIRLTQARAKCEMRKVCTKSDANEVIEIMKVSMVDYYENEFGELDTSRSVNGSYSSSSGTVSTIKTIKALGDYLYQMKKGGIKEISTEDLHKLIQKTKIKNSSAECVFKLNEFGCIIKSSTNDSYRIT